MTPADLLQQNVVWQAPGGVLHDLRTMDANYRSNLIPFLRGNAMTVATMCGAETSGRQEAEEWLEQTPLMRRLCELERGRPLEERRATAERNRAYEEATGYQKVRLG